MEAIEIQYRHICTLLVTNGQEGVRHFSPSGTLVPETPEYRVFEKLELLLVEGHMLQGRETGPLWSSLIKLGLIGSFEVEIFAHRIGDASWRLLTIIEGEPHYLCNMVAQDKRTYLEDLPRIFNKHTIRESVRPYPGEASGFSTRGSRENASSKWQRPKPVQAVSSNKDPENHDLSDVAHLIAVSSLVSFGVVLTFFVYVLIH